MNVFSSGKSLETLGIAYLVDKGLLDYSDKIADHWPEFAANGKGEITVADLMRHEAGLMSFKKTFEPEEFFSDSIKQNSIGKVIEGLSAKIPNNPRERRNYHAMTRGWVVNELFRRVEPNGRTLGEYLKQDIAEPLSADINVGVGDDDLGRRASVKGVDFGFYLLETLKPKFMGRKVQHSMADILALFTPMFFITRRAMQKNKLARQKSPSKPANASSGHRRGAGPFRDLSPMRDRAQLVRFFNKPVVAQGESASFNANCSARGLAKVAAMMAGGGSFEGKEYFGRDAWKALHANADLKKLGGMVSTQFTQGGVNLYSMNGAKNNRRNRSLNQHREGFYGWMGLGGSIFQWNPDEEIGFAFVPTSMHIIDIFNERGKVYQKEAVRCARARAVTAKAS